MAGIDPTQKSVDDETRVDCVFAGQFYFVGLRAGIRAKTNTCIRRDAITHRNPRANKHRHAYQYSHSHAYCCDNCYSDTERNPRSYHYANCYTNAHTDCKAYFLIPGP